MKDREGQCEELSVRAMDGAADLQGCVNPSRSDWPSLSIAPSPQRQLHPANRDNCTQPTATIAPSPQQQQHPAFTTHQS
ncbi:MULTISPECIES: hypothetical protein [unclassified Pantoea]|uniref:hypothetical protein n=1 Tax=unclassified Pantoea TaxID=2630326 RepID=UPI001CD33D42|nr:MULTISPECIES: hypothetical protein [unclassified Pantoea]MCA1176052.1 hypothetical protein [Pantoea sp. alder69]MCA1249023.1 hypothetical protein [Pantoea sp. alder70]MCA1264902.1 hypothetical protein [Pantoea sp. alder81]